MEEEKIIKRGSVIKFGKYPRAYTEDEQIYRRENYIYKEEYDWLYDRPRTLHWKVLTVEGYKALVFCKMIVDYRMFDEQEWSIWKDTKLRDWLNNDFYEHAFNKRKKRKMLTTMVVTEVDREGETIETETTQDKIFILSMKELFKYWFKTTMKCDQPYWIRDRHDNFMSGYYTGCSLDHVYSDDIRINDERDTEEKLAVRPAMWININLL